MSWFCRTGTILTLAIASASMAGGVARAGDAQAMLQRLAREGVRGMWIWPGGGTHFQQPLASNGVNTASIQCSLLKGAEALVPQGQPLPVDPSVFNAEELERMGQAIGAASAAGVVPLISLYHLDNVEVGLLARLEYRKVMLGDGRQAAVAPCPLDRDYWHGVVLPQWRQIAHALAKADALGGVTMENESYAADMIYPGYWDPKLRVCYCDHCMTGFLQAQSRPAASLPPAARRGQWVLEQGLAVAHRQFMEESFAGVIREMVDEARRIHPWFLVAQYPYFPGWFCDGILQGAHSEVLPSILFSHVEYFGGYDEAVSAGHQLHLRQRGSHVLYAGGMTIGWYWPLQHALSQVDLRARADGWWIYWGGSLLDSNFHQRLPGSPDFAKLSFEYRLLGEPQSYWRFMRQGCDWAGSSLRQAAGTERGGSAGDSSTRSDRPVVTHADVASRGEVRLTDDDKLCFEAASELPASLLPDWSHPAQRQKWEGLQRVRIDATVQHGAAPSLLLGPFDEPGAGKGEYVQTTVAVPRGRRLMLWAWYQTDGPDPLVFLGLGKLNWYWHYPVSGQTDGQWRRLEVILESRPLEHMLVDNHRETSDSMTIRLHVLPTRNRVWLGEVRLEPIHTIELRAGAPGFFSIPGDGTLESLQWDASRLGRTFRVDLYDATSEQPLIRDYRPARSLRPLREAFGIQTLRPVLTAHLTASQPAIEMANPRWIITPAATSPGVPGD